jgi:hypothetical protein
MSTAATAAGAAIAQSLERRATGWMVGVRFSAGITHFSLLHSMQRGSGDHPALCTMGNGGGRGWKNISLGREVDNSPPHR